jgi:hypothetical protein
MPIPKGLLFLVVMLASFNFSRAFRFARTSVNSKITQRHVHGQQVRNAALLLLSTTSKSYASGSRRGFLMAAGGMSLAAGVAGASDGAECSGASKDKFAGTAFFPEIPPYEKGTLKVSDIHTIAYSVSRLLLRVCLTL